MRSAYVVRRPVENAYLVREQDRRLRRELLLVLLAILPVALALLANIWTQLQVLQTGYEIERLEARRHTLTEYRRQLLFEAAYLAGPARIEQLAREQGLDQPAPEQIVAAEDLR